MTVIELCRELLKYGPDYEVRVATPLALESGEEVMDTTAVEPGGECEVLIVVQQI